MSNAGGACGRGRTAFLEVRRPELDRIDGHANALDFFVAGDEDSHYFFNRGNTIPRTRPADFNGHLRLFLRGVDAGVPVPHGVVVQQLRIGDQQRQLRKDGRAKPKKFFEIMRPA